ncbi:hypothetical protein DFAR_570024 [Desulfarculales bacterium]
MDETQFKRLFFSPPSLPSTGFRPASDWSQAHQELRRKGMALTLLWEEYKAVHTRIWSGKLGLIMRQKHRVSEKTFIDYTGQTVDVVVPLMGEVLFFGLIRRRFSDYPGPILPCSFDQLNSVAAMRMCSGKTT